MTKKGKPFVIGRDFKDILNIFFVIALLYFTGHLFYYHYQIISSPYPLEYREGALMAPTYLMLKGGNPYNLEFQPQYTDVYGMMYHWVMYPLVRILGPQIWLYRLISGVFILAACVFLFVVLRREKIPVIYSWCGIVFYYA